MAADPGPASSPAGRDTASRLVKNSLWLFFAEGASKLLALLTQVIAARHLGEAGFGIFNFAFSATGACIVFLDTGLSLYLTREVSHQPERANEILKNVFRLKWGVSLVTAALLAGGLSAAGLQPAVWISAAAIGAALMVQGYADMDLAVFRAFERMRTVSFMSVLARILFFVLGLGTLLAGGDVVAFSMAFLAASCVHFGIVRWRAAAHFRFGPAPVSSDRMQQILRHSLPVCGVVLFTYIGFRSDAILIFFFLGEAQTGIYSAAFKLIEALSLLIASVRMAMFPVFSRAFQAAEDSTRRLWEEAVRVLLWVGWPLAVGLAMLADRRQDRRGRPWRPVNHRLCRAARGRTGSGGHLPGRKQPALRSAQRHDRAARRDYLRASAKAIKWSIRARWPSCCRARQRRRTNRPARRCPCASHDHHGGNRDKRGRSRWRYGSYPSGRTGGSSIVR